MATRTKTASTRSTTITARARTAKGRRASEDDAGRTRTRIIAYMRVSTPGQVEDGISLTAQRERCQQYAGLYGLDIVASVEDRGLSGRSLQRPGLQRALALLDQGEADGILVASLSRLTRSIRDLGLLLDAGLRDRWALFSIAECLDARSAGGRLVLAVLTSVAAWEAEAAGERTRASLAHLRAQGVRLGGEGLGWRRTRRRDGEGRLVVETVPAEARVARRIVKLRADGHTLQGIVDQLTADQVPTKRGGVWRISTVQRVLARAERD